MFFKKLGLSKKTKHKALEEDPPRLSNESGIGASAPCSESPSGVSTPLQKRSHSSSILTTDSDRQSKSRANSMAQTAPNNFGDIVTQVPRRISQTQALEDWDVVNLNDLPRPDKLLPMGGVAKAQQRSNNGQNHKQVVPVLPRSSGSVGSRSLFSTFASRMARVFTSNSSLDDEQIPYLPANHRRRHYSGDSVAQPPPSPLPRSHNSSVTQFPSSGRPKQVIATDLSDYMDHSGCITMRALLKKDVFERGVDPSIRQIVWPILLGVYPPTMSQNERVAWLKKRSNEYLTLRSEWQNLLVDYHHPKNRPGSAFRSRFSSPLCLPSSSNASSSSADTSYLRSIVTAVRKDAIRTDRTHPMFAAEDSPWTTALFNLLVTFAFSHPSIGYCQGMSDLASPLLVVMRDEASAYVCFCALMVRMRRNFSPSDDSSMASKFTVLALLLRHYCPRLHRFLASQGADDLLFSYRWLFLEMKREFPLDDCAKMLEVIWAAVPDQYLHQSSANGQELPLSEPDYRKRSSVLTGDISSVQTTENRKSDQNSREDLSEPSLFDSHSPVNSTPPRRLISCATAARCGSQHYLNNLGLTSHSHVQRHVHSLAQQQHSHGPRGPVSASLLQLPHQRTSSDCTQQSGHASSFANIAGARNSQRAMLVALNQNRHKGALSCCPTSSFQSLIAATAGNSASNTLPVPGSKTQVKHSHHGSIRTGPSSAKQPRTRNRKRRTSFPPSSSSPALIDPSKEKTNNQKTENDAEIPAGQLDTTGDSAVAVPRNFMRGESVITEAETEGNTLATASSSAEYDASSSEYGGDEELEDSSVSSLDAVDPSSIHTPQAQVQLLSVSNSGMVLGSYDSNGSTITRANQPPSTSSPVSVLNSSNSSHSAPATVSLASPSSISPLKMVRGDSISVRRQMAPDLVIHEESNASAHCSQGEDALQATDEVLDDSCEVATEAILSNSLNTSGTAGQAIEGDSVNPILLESQRLSTQHQNSSISSTIASSYVVCNPSLLLNYDSGMLTAPHSEIVTSEDEDIELPTLHELGDSPFVVFVALTMLLQHRPKLMQVHMDYNEIHIFFDKMVRKHNADAVLVEARRLYNAFIEGKNVGSSGSSHSNLSRLFGLGKARRRQKSLKNTRSMPVFNDNVTGGRSHSIAIVPASQRDSAHSHVSSPNADE